ncbi:MAG: ABC transporter ATP-binding protein [Lachnospiraceae bacterium]
MQHALEIKHLSKSYKNSSFTLDDINLTVPKGSIVGIVGKNGAGKSTTINALFDIIHKDSGEVLFYGMPLTKQHRDLKHEIGVVFDSSPFPGEMNIKQLEKVLVDLYHSFEIEKFHEFIQTFDLPIGKKLKHFSRGMAMKLSIAVALSHGAKLLILDEATAGLDPVVREEILDLFLDFVSDEEHAILMSSHITSDLEKVADYITFIDDGQIIFTENKDTLIYEYGIARMKEQDLKNLSENEYIVHRKRGLQIEALVKDKASFMKNHPSILVDSLKIDEILPLIVKGENC